MLVLAACLPLITPKNSEYEVTVIEASDRVGGRILNLEVDGDDLIERAVSDLEQYLPGFKHNIKKARVTRHRRAVARYAPGTHGKIIEFKQRVKSIPGLSIISNDLDGVHLETAVTSAKQAVESFRVSRPEPSQR